MTLATEIPVKLPSLDELAQTANRESRLARQAFEKGLEHAILAGEALLEARRICPRNEWVEWVEKNFDGAYVTAMAHLRMAMHKQEILTHPEVNSVNAATKYLRGDKYRISRLSPEVEEEARRLRDHGDSYEVIAEKLDVSNSCVWNLLNPAARAERKERARQAQMRRAAAEDALRREERSRAVKRAGGPVAESYSLIRRALQALEDASAREGQREARLAIHEAMQRLYEVEDAIVRASKLSHPAEERRAA